MRIKRVNMSDGAGMNMTPMIDIVFQLIVFLMLASDFANLKIDALNLPVAEVATSDDHPDPNRVTVNILHEPPVGLVCSQLEYDHEKLIRTCNSDAHWKIKVNGEELTQVRLKEILTVEGNINKDKPLMIRPDSGAPYRFLASVLQAASEAKLWNMEIGARRPAK
ncbi:MAG: biopolymer transporter ExbD [Planctomycetes bacterium]|nr:biopolymer transporter ExbD [Planctomycetota bacterium]